MHNEILNAKYERNPANYPEIEVKKNEILKFNDGSDRTFVIKDIKEKSLIISADQDYEYSFAAFLRWVKKKEVQKMTAETEAAMATEQSEDGDEKKFALAAATQDESDRLEQAKKDPKARKGLPSPHENSNHSVSYFRKLWTDTKLISPHNMYTMGKTFYDFIKRKLGRREHYAVGAVGNRMFGSISDQVADEFKSLAKHAENEEVELHAKHNKTIGVDEIKEDLHSTTNRERVKAAIDVLCEKGQMRWDDPVFHETLNKMIRKYGLVKKDGVPVWVNAKNHLESIEIYLDEWFGADTFRNLRNRNDSAYKSIRSSFEEQAGRLEADPEGTGGLRGALQKLLFKHMKGEYVNPAQYEEYLHYSIKAGKLFFEDKVYFLIMGLGMESPAAHGHPGQTLLHLDRLGALESEFLNNFPVLDYFTANNWQQYNDDGSPKIEKGEPVKGKVTTRHFKELAMQITKGGLEKVKDYRQLNFGERLTEMITKEMLWDSSFRTRLEKASRKTDQWDHDDMDMHAPFLSEVTVEQIVKSQGNATMNVSTPGLRNALVGFNNFIKITHEMLDDDTKSGNAELMDRDIKGITNMVLAFTKMDSILMNRYRRNEGGYSRLSTADYNTTAGADSSRKVKVHVQEVHNYIAALTTALDAKTGGAYDLTGTWRNISKPDMTENDKQEANNAMNEFRNRLEGACSQISQKELAEMMLSIQKPGSGRPMVQGILGEKKKTVEEEATTEDQGFSNIFQDSVKSRVAEIRSLQAKIASGGEKAKSSTSNTARVQELIKATEEGKKIGGPDDIPILDEEIKRLTNQLKGGGEQKKKAA